MIRSYHLARGKFSKGNTNWNRCMGSTGVLWSRSKQNEKKDGSFFLPMFFFSAAMLLSQQHFLQTNFCEKSLQEEYEKSTLNNHNYSDRKQANTQYTANKEIEDRFVYSHFPMKDGVNFVHHWSIFDGHGGPQVAEFAHSKIHEILYRYMENISGENEADRKWTQRIIEAFYYLDEQIYHYLDAKNLSSKKFKIGACGISLLLTPTQIIVANAGDCKAVLSSSNRVIPLSVQHTANCPKERQMLFEKHPLENDVVICKRTTVEKVAPDTFFESKLYSLGLIKEKSAVVPTACYVKGRLQPTRSFGDFHLKREQCAMDTGNGKYFVKEPFSFPYISCHPDVKIWKRREEDEFVIMGTDGLWDFFTDKDACDFVRERLNRGMSVADITAEMVEKVLEVAAKNANLTLEEVKNLPLGIRRKIHDDTTINIILLKEWEVSPSNK